MSDYFETLEMAIPSKKLHRAALNHFFDYQVQRHAAVLNPVSSVRNECYEVHEGKTPEITIKEAKSEAARIRDLAGRRAAQGWGSW